MDVRASYGTSAPSASLTVNSVPAWRRSFRWLPAPPASWADGVDGHVTLSSPAPAGGAVVTLSSSNAAVATVPASVTVLAGATSAGFSVTTMDVSASTIVTLTAAYGGSTRTAILAVDQAPVVATLASVSLSPASVVGGTGSTGTVTLSSAAPAGGAVVTLSSSSRDGGGSSERHGPCRRDIRWLCGDDHGGDCCRNVTISAVYGGGTRTAEPGGEPGAVVATLTSVSLSPASVVGGTGSTGTVTLSSAAPAGGAVVTLSSSSPATAAVPASVTVLAAPPRPPSP